MSHLIKIYAVCKFSHFHLWYLKELILCLRFSFQVSDILLLKACDLDICCPPSNLSTERTVEKSKKVTEISAMCIHIVLLSKSPPTNRTRKRSVSSMYTIVSF